jgi:hypothetical protein
MEENVSTNTKFTFWQTIIVTIITAIVSISTVLINKGIDKPVSEDKLDTSILQSIKNHLNSKEVKNQIKLEVNSSSEKIPIGTVIASVFDYNTFLSIQGQGLTQDMSKAIWVPCDGRLVNNSKYSLSNFGVKVPDLRGLFLRNVNDYNINFPKVKPVSKKQKNPQNKLLGEFQYDAFQGHHHAVDTRTGVTLSVTPGGQAPLSLNWGKHSPAVRDPVTDKKNGTPRVSSETRPKNFTISYFIKIN